MNNAAPNLVTPVDVYVWLSGTAIPATPTVPGLGLNQDSGSSATHPGDAYIPQQGSATDLPAGTYDIAVVLAGTAPNGATDLFDGATPFSLNASYSLTIEDIDGTSNNIGVISSIDEPFQGSNQTSISRRAIR